MISPNKIDTAFSTRKLPDILCSRENVDEHDFKDVEEFCSSHWSKLNCNTIEKYFDVLPLLSPDAFLYFLPGVIKAGVEEGCPNLLINQSLVSNLDRSPDPENWDSYFLARWSKLRKDECNVVEEWLLWLGVSDSCLFSECMIDRALETIALIRNLENKTSV